MSTPVDLAKGAEQGPEIADIGEPEPAPPRTRLSRLADTAVVAWLALLGIASVAIGGHDAVAATAINLRLVGSLLLAAGVMLLAGAAGMLHRRPMGLSLAMMAALIGVAIGVMTFLTQVVNDDPDRRLIAWALVIAASGAAALHVRAATPPSERAKSVVSRLPILKSAISLGLVASVVQFWYQVIYVPTTAPVSLTLTAKIDKLTQRVTPSGKYVVIEGSVTVQNSSDAKVQVLASSLDLVGSRVVPEEVDREAYEAAVDDSNLEELGTADRHASQEYEQTVSHARLVGEGKFFEAGETITVPVLTWVPKGRYNALYLFSWIASGRAKALGIENAEPKTSQVDREVIYVTRLPNAGWLHDLTRGDRYLRVAYDKNPRIYEPVVTFASTPGPNPPPGFSRRLARFYGVSTTKNEAAVAVP